MSNLKYKLEALLFSSARSMKIEELSRLTKASHEEIRETLNELKKEYEQRDSSITLIDEGASFKLNVKSEHIPIVQQIVTETELSKTLMETLAVIAFKYPLKQSDLIKLRTNKAYDHLKELEEMEYITRQKYGRTKLIKLTPKFFEYFDLPPEKLKEKFEDFRGIAKAIKEKEDEIKQIKEEMKKMAEEAGKKEKGKGEEEPEIDLIDQKGHKKKLKIYEEPESELEQEEAKFINPYKEKLGSLEVTDIPEKEGQEETEELTEGEQEEEREGLAEETEEEPKEGTEKQDEETELTPMTEETDQEFIEKIKEEIPEEETEETTQEKGTQEPISEEETQEETEEPTEEEAQEETEPMPEEKTQESAPEEETEEPSDKKPSEETEEKTKTYEGIESEVDRRVEELLHPKKTEKKTKKPIKEPQEEQSEEEQEIRDFSASDSNDSEEPKDLLEAAAEEEKKRGKNKR